MVRDNYVRRPLTMVLIACIALFMLWMGVTLLNLHLPPARLAAFKGPLEFGPLHLWGWAFLLLGAVQGSRLWLLRYTTLDTVLHVASMAPVVAWALSFDIQGQLSTAQPAYTFVAAATVTSPFISHFIIKRQPLSFQASIADKLAQLRPIVGTTCALPRNPQLPPVSVVANPLFEEFITTGSEAKAS